MVLEPTGRETLALPGNRIFKTNYLDATGKQYSFPDPTQCLDGQTLETLNRGEKKQKASNAHVSILAHITPFELRKLLRSLWASRNL